MQPDIQWFIARDGRQHGPISDVEMKKLAELGHLRPADLVWRQGFVEWTPAHVAFPAQSPVMAPAPTELRPMPAPQAAPMAPAAQPRKEPAAARPVAPTVRTSDQGRPAPAPQNTGSQGTSASRAQPAPQPFEMEASPRRSARTLTAGLVLIGLFAGGSWLAYKNGVFKALNRATSTPSVAKAEIETAAAKAPGKPVVASSPREPNYDGPDAAYQRNAHWVVIKREFPDWYQERITEADRLASDNKSPAEIAKYLAGEIVKLRKQHATEALSAPTERLVSLAAAFLANLKALQLNGPTACYSFIARGENTPLVAEMLQSPETGAAVQAQVATVFEAIAEGRNTPAKHPSPQKSDYDLLAKELEGIGWNPADMQMFSNPKALSAASPEQVCKMVQDWFKAHLSLKDAAAQERLLIETLKPVVGG